MGKIHIITGSGHGKYRAALGEALLAAARGEHVMIVHFLKGHNLGDFDFQKRLEPQIRQFRFEKSDCDFLELTKERRQEEIANIRNGLNFAKKVLNTGECDLLILDEVLGLLENEIITEEDLKNVLAAQGWETNVVLTGRGMGEAIGRMADSITYIETQENRVDSTMAG